MGASASASRSVREYALTSDTVSEARAPASPERGATSLASAGGPHVFVGFDSGCVSAHASGASSPATLSWDAHDAGVTSLSFAASARLLVTASRDATARLWRVGDATAAASMTPPVRAGELRGHSLTVSAVVASDDASVVATGSRDCSVRVWDASTSREVACASRAQNVVTALTLVGDGPRALIAQAGEDLRVRLWDVRGGALSCGAELGGYVYFPLALASSADGVRLVSASKGFCGKGGEVREWDVRAPASPVAVRVLPGHSMDATAVVLVPDGRILSASKDGTLRVWPLVDDGAPALVIKPRDRGDEVVAVFTALAVVGDGDVAAAALDTGLYTFQKKGTSFTESSP